MLQQLIYVSSSVSWSLGAEAGKILDVSRRRNAALDVTGLLVFGRGEFFQILEGPPAAVAKIFESIKRDPRHRSIITIIDEEAPERLFGAWSMGWRELSGCGADDEKIKVIRDIRSTGIGGGDGSVLAKSLLISFLSSGISSA